MNGSKAIIFLLKEFEKVIENGQSDVLRHVDKTCVHASDAIRKAMFNDLKNKLNGRTDILKDLMSDFDFDFEGIDKIKRTLNLGAIANLDNAFKEFSLVVIIDSKLKVEKLLDDVGISYESQYIDGIRVIKGTLLSCRMRKNINILFLGAYQLERAWNDNIARGWYLGIGNILGVYVKAAKLIPPKIELSARSIALFATEFSTRSDGIFESSVSMGIEKQIKTFCDLRGRIDSVDDKYPSYADSCIKKVRLDFSKSNSFLADSLELSSREYKLIPKAVSKEYFQYSRGGRVAIVGASSITDLNYESNSLKHALKVLKSYILTELYVSGEKSF